MINQLIIHFISFLAITLSASQVHDEMQKLKDMTRNWRSGNQRHLTVDQRIALMLKIDDVSLTVWGVFNITKNFVLSAFGAILTYSVLISSLTD